MKGSLSFRLALASSLVLAAFLTLAGVTLERAYKEGSEQAVKERLKIHIYAILSAAELSPNGEITLPKELRESRFSTVGSGLLAAMFDERGALVWRSLSNVGKNPLDYRSVEIGDAVYPFIANGVNGTGFYSIWYGFAWVDIEGVEHRFTLAVGEDANLAQSQLSAFRNTLWLWLGAIVFVLVIAQAVILRWGLGPLRKIAHDIKAIEDGEQERIYGNYPKEISVLSNNINVLIDNERAHLERYRNSLADLAHSLKTPLAILRGCSENSSVSEEIKKTLEEQVGRMDELVEYQLNRAAAKGSKTFFAPVLILPILNKIARSLEKVYQAREINWNLDVPGDIKLFCDEGDLYEIFGNLLDNGCKWCNSTVSVSAHLDAKTGLVTLCIEDDGPGIPEEKLSEVMTRGVRADEKVKGHGIGLAVVNELVSLSKGTITGSNGDRGGMSWLIALPGSR